MFTLIVSICVLFPSKSQGQIRGHNHSERAVLFKQRRFGGAPSRIWHFLQGCLQTDCQRCGQGRKWFWIHGLMILWLVLLLISLSPLFLSRVLMCSCSPASLLSLCVVTFTVRLRLTVSSKSYNYIVWAILSLFGTFRVRWRLIPRVSSSTVDRKSSRRSSWSWENASAAVAASRFAKTEGRFHACPTVSVRERIVLKRIRDFSPLSGKFNR